MPSIMLNVILFFMMNSLKYFLKVLKFKGVLNIGGKSQTIYSFAKKYNKDVKKKKSKGELPLNINMSLKKVNKLVKK